MVVGKHDGDWNHKTCNECWLFTTHSLRRGGQGPFRLWMSALGCVVTDWHFRRTHVILGVR